MNVLTILLDDKKSPQHLHRAFQPNLRHDTRLFTVNRVYHNFTNCTNAIIPWKTQWFNLNERNNNIALKLKVNHPQMCVFSYTHTIILLLWSWSWPSWYENMTYIFWIRTCISKMKFLIKALKSWSTKRTDRQTHTHTKAWPNTLALTFSGGKNATINQWHQHQLFTSHCDRSNNTRFK